MVREKRCLLCTSPFTPLSLPQNPAHCTTPQETAYSFQQQDLLRQTNPVPHVPTRQEGCAVPLSLLPELRTAFSGTNTRHGATSTATLVYTSLYQHFGQYAFSYEEAYSSRQFCWQCIEKLPRSVLGHCPLCGELSPWPLAPNTPCSACLKSAPPWRSFVFHSPYEGLLRTMILCHKFSGKLSIGFALGQLLAQHPALKTLHFDTVIPVPLHPERLRQRGYNQAVEIAKGLIPLYTKKARLAVDLLRRIRPTKPQIGLSHVERRKNVQGVFSTACTLKSHHILLIDDVFTTGSTLRECTEVLYKAGAEAVHVATLTRARRHFHI